MGSGAVHGYNMFVMVEPPGDPFSPVPFDDAFHKAAKDGGAIASRWSHRAGEGSVTGRRARHIDLLDAAHGFALAAALVALLNLAILYLPGLRPLPADAAALLMRPDMAVVVILVASVMALGHEGRRGRLALALAVVALVVLSLTLVTWLANTELGVTALFGRDPVHDASGLPKGRVPPAAIAGVLMLVGASGLVQASSPRARLAGQVLAMAAVLVANFSILVFLLGPADPVGIVPYLFIPLSTGVAWTLLAGAILLTHADEGPVTLLVGHDLAARVTRSLLVVALLGIPLIGWLRRTAEDAGIIGAPVGNALFAALAAGALAVAAVVTGSLIRGYQRASLAARAERDRYVELAEDLFAIILPSGYLHWVNPAWERVLAWTAGDLMAVPLADFVHPDDVEMTAVLWQPSMAGARRVAFENRMRHRDGSYRWVQWNAIQDPADDLTYADGRDVTGQRALEAQLLQAHKMEAVGQLAGGVAHDFNNLLTAIKGFAELIAGAGAPDEQRTADARQIGRAADQGAQLTRQLLAFSRRHPVQPDELDLGEVVTHSAPMLRQLVGEGIVVDVSAEPDLAHVFADRGQLEQVLLNLAANARDAMPDGGSLHLAVATWSLDRAFVRAHPGARAGTYVALSVSDTGSGMDEETLAHIFEPFFTTKAPGEGTGLGLAGAYGIVKQAGGYIDAASEPGNGSTFRIFLPAVAPSSPAAEPATEPTHERLPGTETILLVEDEAGVRLFAQRALEAQGYRVLPFEDPVQAFDSVVADPAALDAIVTDVVMPGMSGWALARRIHGLRPGLPVLFVSGYASGRLADHSAPRLAKPFSGADLAHAVAALFGRNP